MSREEEEDDDGLAAFVVFEEDGLFRSRDRLRLRVDDRRLDEVSLLDEGTFLGLIDELAAVVRRRLSRERDRDRDRVRERDRDE